MSILPASSNAFILQLVCDPQPHIDEMYKYYEAFINSKDPAERKKLRDAMVRCCDTCLNSLQVLRQYLSLDMSYLT